MASDNGGVTVSYGFNADISAELNPNYGQLAALNAPASTVMFFEDTADPFFMMLSQRINKP
jgi:hypothetical protein